MRRPDLRTVLARGMAKAPRLRSRTRELGSLYRGREGQWTWVAHRLTGVGIILFLFAHVIDTALVGWGPEAYNKVVAVYHNDIVRLLELGLVAAVMWHALNGTRIILFDFFPRLADRNRPITWVTVALFVATMIPITAIIVRPIIRGWFA